AKPALSTRRMNNVMMAVSDLNRSIAFYEKLFGPAVRDGEVAIFRVGGGPYFFGLTPMRPGAKAGYLSYRVTVDDFDAERVMRALTSLGITTAELTRRGDTPEIFISDPNGIRLQLQHVAYGHGSGPLGDILSPAPSVRTTPIFQLKTVNHVT